MIDVIFGGTHVCVLLNFGTGVTSLCYHNNHRFIMRTDNVSKVTLSVQNSLSIIMCKFRAVQSKTEGMAASVAYFLNTPRITYRLKTENGFAPPSEYCRHILSCGGFQVASFKGCLRAVSRSVSL